MRESLDRLAPALVASDLSVTDHLDDAHFVAALGYASKAYPLASPLIRMYLAHDAAAVREARKIVFDMAKRAAARQGELLRASDLAAVARMALEYSANKVCVRCHGTKYEPVPGTNRLSTRPCLACGGDGRRQIPRRFKKIVVEVVARIERVESSLDVIVAKRV